jgi:hypothetical protein
MLIDRGSDLHDGRQAIAPVTAAITALVFYAFRLAVDPAA